MRGAGGGLMIGLIVVGSIFAVILLVAFVSWCVDGGPGAIYEGFQERRDESRKKRDADEWLAAERQAKWEPTESHTGGVTVVKVELLAQRPGHPPRSLSAIEIGRAPVSDDDWDLQVELLRSDATTKCMTLNRGGI